MKQGDDTGHDIGGSERAGEGQDPRQSTLSCNTEEDYLNHHQEVLLLSQACQVTSLRTTRVSLPKHRCHAHTLIPYPVLPNA
jgi:hypothetical protein